MPPTPGGKHGLGLARQETADRHRAVPHEERLLRQVLGNRFVYPQLKLDVEVEEPRLVALVVVGCLDHQCVGDGEVELVESVEPALPLLGWLWNTEMLAKTQGGDAVGPGESL